MTGKGQHRCRVFGPRCRVVVGFLEKPDIRFANGIKRLGRECRECRVFLAGESARRIRKDRRLRIQICAIR